MPSPASPLGVFLATTDSTSVGTLSLSPKHLENEQRKSYNCDPPSPADFGSLHSHVTRLIHAARQNSGSRVCGRLYGMERAFTRQTLEVWDDGLSLSCGGSIGRMSREGNCLDRAMAEGTIYNAWSMVTSEEIVRCGLGFAHRSWNISSGVLIRTMLAFPLRSGGHEVSMGRSVLITGITGQDGSYLAEFLLE